MWCPTHTQSFNEETKKIKLFLCFPLGASLLQKKKKNGGKEEDKEEEE